MRFSQRIGLTPITKLAQIESIDDELRISLWNSLTSCYWDRITWPGYGTYKPGTVAHSNLEPLVRALWFDQFKRPTDQIGYRWSECLSEIRHYFSNAKWHEVYDFVEFVAQRGPKEFKRSFIELVNRMLERENSAYRFVGEELSEITSADEIESVEAALSVADEYRAVRAHLKSALELLSDRQAPDYRNSIKESISAVEALAQKLAKNEKGTLGDILKELEKARTLHPALRKTFTSLYGYTNDADGIRHAMSDESKLTKADARFMLVCCSAFTNYVIERIPT